MQTVAHLSEAKLKPNTSRAATHRSRHLQTIRLLAKGHSVAKVSTITTYGKRWIEQLRARYNADGLAALGDQRRGLGRGDACQRGTASSPCAAPSAILQTSPSLGRAQR
ncbi:MAG: helix-turn-helix domain-containing protein [Janthinobacterium lividum]